PRTTRTPAPRCRPETTSSTRPSSNRAEDDERSSANTSAKSPPDRNATASVREHTSGSITRRLGYSDAVASWPQRLCDAGGGGAGHRGDLAQRGRPGVGNPAVDRAGRGSRRAGGRG